MGVFRHECGLPNEMIGNFSLQGKGLRLGWQPSELYSSCADLNEFGYSRSVSALK